jgi:hypothetical protein
MAPEQARGESQVSYAVDVFALGCVLFECVTGRPAFQGQHVMAILAKLLLEDPPPPVALVPEMSAGLSALIERMLRKEPEDRPPDAGKVWQELSELSAQEPCVATAASPGVSTAERRIFSVVAIASSYATTTLGTTTTRDASAPDHTLIGVVRHAVAPLGGRLHVLLDGTILISITDGHPQDQAQRAARCAIWTRETACSLALALVTGWGEAGAESPVGELLDRAAAILAAAPPLGHRPERGLILLDATSRELLESNFEIAEEDGCIVLRDEHRLGEVSPMLLGRATPFVGRQRELRNIVDIVVEAIEEKEPTIVLVSGEAGLGKSRVRRELIMALRRSEVEPQILTGRGDLMTRGSAFATIGSIFHDALELGAGGPVESQREKIEFIVNLFAPPEHRRRVTEFLGEILRVHFPDSESPQLRAARQNPQLMADQVARAYVDFVRGFAATRPSAIILDDLHWADAPSLQLIEAAIAALCEDRVAYVVVAFARPELDERFPRLWAKLRLHRVHLTPLSRRATTELAREVLGDTASDEAIQGMVERAGGNPLFLEELLRGHAGGRSDAASATVLGMFDRRVAALPNELRRFLRAASVFGEAFWLAGVRTLLGGPAEPDESGAWIALLLRDELIVRRASRRFTSVPEYGFRHSLLRDGVYATLTDKDRVTAHRLAGQWLRDNGESDPAVLGHHFDLGGEADEAASYYARAAEQALAASDYTACLRLAERGLALGPVRGPVADLWALVADAAFWSRDPERAMQAAGSAMAISRPGSRSDCRALGDMLAAGLFHRGSASEPRRWLDRLLATEPDPDAASTLAWGFDAAMLYRVCVEPNDELTSHVRRLEAIVATADADDPLVAAWLANVRASWHRAQGRPWAALRSARSAAEGFERAGYRRYLPYSYAFVGIDLVLVGDFVGGDAELRRSAALAQVGSVQAFVASHFAATSALWQGRSARTHELTASSQQSASGKESLPPPPRRVDPRRRLDRRRRARRGRGVPGGGRGERRLLPLPGDLVPRDPGPALPRAGAARRGGAGARAGAGASPRDRSLALRQAVRRRPHRGRAPPRPRRTREGPPPGDRGSQAAPRRGEPAR